MVHGMGQGHPGHLLHSEDSQWSAPEPLSMPIHRGPHPYDYDISHFPSQWQPSTSLGITKPHPENSEAGWEAAQMIWWEKWGIYDPKEPANPTCHPHLSKSTQIGHMARRMCLFQTEPHSQISSLYSILSHVTLLSTFSYLASNPSMITRLWKWEWFHFHPTTDLNATWRPFNSGPLMRNLFHPTYFSQSSSSSPQFSSLQSETSVLKLWECTEYICLLLLHLALFCFNSSTNGHLPRCNSQASF